MNPRMNEEGRWLNTMPSFDQFTLPVDQKDIAGTNFAPVQSLRINQILSGHPFIRIMITNTFIEPKVSRPTQGCRQVFTRCL